jgi:DNA-binding transcriptional LysR family regulator
MDRADDLAVFVEIAEHGSFSHAARKMGRSPAAVTRSVANLEMRLGVRLFNRTTRAVSLTDAGQRLLVGARRVLGDLAEIEQAAAGQGNAPRGELSVTAPIVFGRLHVLPIVTEFLTRFPDVTVRLALADRPVDLVEEGIDAAIRIGELPSTSAIATKVGAVRRIVLAAPEYLARHGEPRHPDNLADHTLIAFSALDGIERWRFYSESGAFEVPIKPRLVLTTAEAAIDAMIGGFGLTRVLCYQAADALTKGSAVRVLRSRELPAAPIHVLYPQGKHLAPKLRAFLDLVVPQLRRRCEAISRALGD